MTGSIAWKRSKAVFWALVMAFAAMTATEALASSWQEDLAYAYAGGTGTEADPFQVATPQQLAWMSNRVQNDNDNTAATYFILTADISLAGKDWIPIGGGLTVGNERRTFNGHFDGNGKTISDLTINAGADGDYQGLFGMVAQGSVVTNLTLAGGRVDGGENLGSIVGNNSGEVSNCTSDVEIIGAGYNIGGLVGYNNGTVSDSEASGDVTGSGANYGGLVGVNDTDGEVLNSTAYGNVLPVSTAEGRFGGLVGSSGGLVSGSRAYGSVIGPAELYTSVGGLVGRLEGGTVDSCEAFGYVQGSLGYAVGGLIGTIIDDGTVTDSTAHGQVVDLSPAGQVNFSQAYVGGLVGTGGTISRSYAYGDVSGRGFVGGLVGSGADISDCAAYGNVTGKATGSSSRGSGVGGLVGYTGATVLRCIAEGSVTGEENVGGLVGYNFGDGSVSDSLAYGNVTGEENVGGLVGRNAGGSVDNPSTVSRSVALGNVYGVTNVGGLVGYNDSLTNIENTLALGAVRGSGDNVGGLVGNIDIGRGSSSDRAPVTLSVAAGSVRGSGANVGGLVGNNTGTVKNSLSVARVDGATGAGGFIGNNTGSASNNAFDRQASVVTAAVGATGIPTSIITNGTNSATSFETETAWKFTSGYYPRPAALAEHEDAKIKAAAALAATPIFLANEETQENAATSFTIPDKDADAAAIVWTSAAGVYSVSGTQVIPASGFDVLTARHATGLERKNFELGVYGADDAPFTISFDLHNGTDTLPSITGVWYAEKIKAPSAPTRPNYTFGGWYKDAGYSDDWNFDTDVVMSDITLHAKWNSSSGVTDYTVTFDSQGGSIVSPVTGVAPGATINSPAAPTRTGYIFTGWYHDSAATQPWDFGADTVTGNVTLYAGWQLEGAPGTFTVTFDSQGGSIVSPVTGVAPGATINSPAAPTRTGYTFTGWYRDSAATQPWNFSTDTVTGNMRLYAGWNSSSSGTGYTVTFNSQGGSYVAPVSGLANGYAVPRPVNPARSGYIFTGWYRDSDATQPWNFGTDTVTGSITLYAGWRAITPSGSGDGGGGGGCNAAGLGALALLIPCMIKKKK